MSTCNFIRKITSFCILLILKQELLKIATKQNNTKLLKVLLDLDLDPNVHIRSEEGCLQVYMRPIHIAAVLGNFEVMALLLDHPRIEKDQYSTRGE